MAWNAASPHAKLAVTDGRVVIFACIWHRRTNVEQTRLEVDAQERARRGVTVRKLASD